MPLIGIAPHMVWVHKFIDEGSELEKFSSDLLYKRELKLNAKDAAGFTALHHVVAFNTKDEPPNAKQLKMVQLFIKFKADINKEDRFGRTPLWYSIANECDDDISGVQCEFGMLSITMATPS